MRKYIKKKVLKVIGKVIEVEANVVNVDWPPICTGFIHQPKRPKSER